ncbi:hypothetical protein Y032_0643g1047 [Ancylostoma ceylanicum]|uniref:Uncharacterized protein n=1 Tax=Ancylostoma ceylanicum TaxID=53326 RepID=A0A016WJD0_9BILA|nr:hypothetical protein Y032_0643g1047 [Ancylostoma ceylanicum]
MRTRSNIFEMLRIYRYTYDKHVTYAEDYGLQRRTFLASAILRDNCGFGSQHLKPEKNELRSRKPIIAEFITAE